MTMRRALVPLALGLIVGCAPAAHPSTKTLAKLSPAPQQEGLPPSNIRIAIDGVLVRSHPLGARAMAALASLPEWRQFVEGTALDPSRDVDSIFVTGPSLIDARHDAVAIRYSARDEDVERAIIALTSQRTGEDSKSSSVDVGVPDVKGWRLYAGGSERVFLRGPEHRVVIAPAKNASAYARELANGALDERPVEGAALSIRARSPARAWGFLPKELVELRARIVPRPGGGAELFVEGDFPDEAAAAKTASELETRLRTMASAGTQEIAVECSAQGLTARARVVVGKADLENLFDFMMAALRVSPQRPLAGLHDVPLTQLAQRRRGYAHLPRGGGEAPPARWRGRLLPRGRCSAEAHLVDAAGVRRRCARRR